MLIEILGAARNQGSWKGFALFGAGCLVHSFREYRSDRSPVFGIHPLFPFCLGIAYVLASISVLFNKNPVSRPLLALTGVLHVVAIAPLLVNRFDRLPEHLKTRYQKANPPPRPKESQKG